MKFCEIISVIYRSLTDSKNVTMAWRFAPNRILRRNQQKQR